MTEAHTGWNHFDFCLERGEDSLLSYCYTFLEPLCIGISLNSLMVCSDLLMFSCLSTVRVMYYLGIWWCLFTWNFRALELLEWTEDGEK